MFVYDALEKMQNKCDGANREDGVGFNKYDSKKVKRLQFQEKCAENELRLKEILEKYTDTQLGGVELRTEYARAKELDESDILLEARVYDEYDKCDLLIRFDYDEDIVKSLGNTVAQFNDKTKNWHAPMDSCENIKEKLSDYRVIDNVKSE